MRTQAPPQQVSPASSSHPDAAPPAGAGPRLAGLARRAVLVGALLWGTLGLVGFQALGIGLCVVPAKTGAMRVTFAGARFARGLTCFILVLVSLAGGAALGGIHGAGSGVVELVRDPALAAATARPAAAPIAEGLVHAVALQIGADPRPMLTGGAPIPVPPLRAVRRETMARIIPCPTRSGA